ncbi:outer membrane lipoprotein carrier protein LolA [Kitasatospora sp. NPDC059571]|uniref:LolA family protein n=1 Tax=Kitasatospora sp. NPDC059571 TaxID=3346871 RepID=UPI0036B4F472
MTEQQGAEPYRPRRRALVRVAVPVAVVAAVGAGVGLVPALASAGGPSLPAVTAEQLVAKVLGSDTQALSGTVQVQADLGLPTQLLGAAAGPVGSGGTGGADPAAKLTDLLGGKHTLQVAVDGPDRQRIGLVENLAGYEVVHNGTDVWAWDSSSNEAVHMTAPQHGSERPGARLPGVFGSQVPATPQQAAEQLLKLGAGTTSVSVDGTTTVAGRSAYRLKVKPTQQGSTIGQVRIAVDAERGVPLMVQAVSTGGATVLDLHFSSVSFATPAASAFAFTVPKGAKVTEHRGQDGAAGRPKSGQGRAGQPAAGPGGASGATVVGEGWTSVVELHLPSGLPEVRDGGKVGHGGPGGAGNPLALAKGFGKPVGGGTLISTKVVNVLVTDDGRVFAGAVTLPVLQHAAGVK